MIIQGDDIIANSSSSVEVATNTDLGVVQGKENISDNNFDITVNDDGTMSLIGSGEIHKIFPYSEYIGKSISKYKVCEYDTLIYQAIEDITNVPAEFDISQWKQIGGRDMELDDKTINKNDESQLQSIGVIEKNKQEVKYDWVGTHSEWVDGRNSNTIPDDWICFITDDFVEERNKTYKSILQLWWSFNTDDYQDGAYAADGREFYKSDFKSETESSNPYNILLRQGTAISYEQYQETIDKFGFCGKFAIDTENEKFRLPTIKDCYVRAGENIGEPLDQSVPNLRGTTADGDRGTHKAGTGVFTAYGSTSFAGNVVASGAKLGYEFNASLYHPAYKDDADVIPYSIVLKPMIQLINYIPKDVSIEFVENTERMIQDLKAVINTLNAKVENMSNSFMPDYSKMVSISSGYITQERGTFQLNLNNYTSVPKVYFDGVEVWTGALYSSERMQGNCFLVVDKGVTITWSAVNSSSLNAYFTPFIAQLDATGGGSISI